MPFSPAGIPGRDDYLIQIGHLGYCLGGDLPIEEKILQVEDFIGYTKPEDGPCGIPLCKMVYALKPRDGRLLVITADEMISTNELNPTIKAITKLQRHFRIHLGRYCPQTSK